MYINTFPNKVFKLMFIKMLTELERRTDEYSEIFNKEMENIRKYQTDITELKNTITELKYTLDWFNSQPDEVEEKISQLEDKAGELTQSEQQKEGMKKE